ncbi:LPS translocon maturation chaperone LptM [Maricurvus nonylphenolicus]
MRHFALLITTLVLLMGLTACGQKGPLYLPESAPADAQKQQSSEG